jgi:hypothetical protein
MKEYTFRVTATITKDVVVLVDNDSMEDEDAALELAREYAHENFNIDCDGDEKYTESSEFVSSK